MPANFAGLKVTPPGPAIAGEAKILRDHGAQVIVVVAHVGTKCKDLDHPNDSSSCDRNEELFKVIGFYRGDFWDAKGFREGDRTHTL